MWLLVGGEGKGKIRKTPSVREDADTSPGGPGEAGWLVVVVFVTVSSVDTFSGSAFDGVEYALEVVEDFSGVDPEDC